MGAIATERLRKVGGLSVGGIACAALQETEESGGGEGGGGGKMGGRPLPREPPMPANLAVAKWKAASQPS